MSAELVHNCRYENSPTKSSRIYGSYESYETCNFYFFEGKGSRGSVGIDLTIIKYLTSGINGSLVMDQLGSTPAFTIFLACWSLRR